MKIGGGCRANVESAAQNHDRVRWLDAIAHDPLLGETARKAKAKVHCKALDNCRSRFLCFFRQGHETIAAERETIFSVRHANGPKCLRTRLMLG